MSLSIRGRPQANEATTMAAECSCESPILRTLLATASTSGSLSFVTYIRVHHHAQTGVGDVALRSSTTIQSFPIVLPLSRTSQVNDATCITVSQ